MQRIPNVPPVILLPGDTTTSDALLHDILDVLRENKAYQLAVLEQQNRLHDSLNDLNRSLLMNREGRHREIDELSFQVDGLREDLNRFFSDPGIRGATHRFRSTTRAGRRAARRPRRVQTPRPTRRSPDLTGSESLGEDSPEDDVDPNLYRYSDATVPIRTSYTPAPTNPRIPSVTTGSTIGSSRTMLHSNNTSNNLRPGSRQRSSQGSSGLTYVSDNPVIPPLPPGFVPYQDQDPTPRQNPFPTPRVPFQQSPLHAAPAPSLPQVRYDRDRTFSES